MRKRWEDLSENYRDRLIRKGVTRQSHEAAASPLHYARGQTSARNENFRKRATTFANRYTNAGQPASTIRHNVLLMGVVEGTRYMLNQRKMVDMYESGDVAGARTMWEQRDQTIPDYMHYYHGVFGY